MLPPSLIGIDFNFMCNSPRTGCSSFHWFDCYWMVSGGCWLWHWQPDLCGCAGV